MQSLQRQQAPRSQTSRMPELVGRQKQEGQLMNIRERSGTVCETRCHTKYRTLFPLVRIPRADILCRMSMRRNSWKHWKRKCSSVTLPRLSRLQAVTARSLSSLQRARQHGSMREDSSLNPMTASDRHPSVPISWQP